MNLAVVKLACVGSYVGCFAFGSRTRAAHTQIWDPWWSDRCFCEHEKKQLQQHRRFLSTWKNSHDCGLTHPNPNLPSARRMSRSAALPPHRRGGHSQPRSVQLVLGLLEVLMQCFPITITFPDVDRHVITCCSCIGQFCSWNLSTALGSVFSHLETL